MKLTLMFLALLLLVMSLDVSRARKTQQNSTSCGFAVQGESVEPAIEGRQRLPEGITAPVSCPITQPPSIEFVPPSPYPTKISPDGFWLGSEKLWTSRSKDGLWRGYWTTEHGVKRKIYFDKVFWWRKGYDWRTENPPQLKVTGRRLDAPGAPFYLDQAHPAFMRNPAMLTGIDIPSVGCWEIAGDYKGDKLTFVVWVVDPPANTL